MGELEAEPADELDEDPAGELEEELAAVLDETWASALEEGSLLSMWMGELDVDPFWSNFSTSFRPRNVGLSMSKEVKVVYLQVLRLPRFRLVSSSLITQKAVPLLVSRST